ncbi:hypothetical protein CYLTODRAFT_458892 [Cylindrobasidium torrendii FP15055 ss-10]|uniref:Uncharacterized protein n=1 Tax=Cylindrobasidium torrendii FP15055 ss-10 TaxID=1314674 RepID=A0A0D7AX21_9AGAR|nr:hypothetical protein CYLTODRAFT_458892 [Cylindrobasidium torrendii FP15055 ss-10]
MVLQPPLAGFAAYLGTTTATTSVVQSNGMAGDKAFSPLITTSRLRQAFPVALYFKTFAEASTICGVWVDFLEEAQPFPQLTVHGATTVVEIAGSPQKSPLLVKLEELGYDRKFDQVLQNCKPIFALPYSQYPGLYIDEDAARLSVQGCAARFRRYNIVTNSFATAFEAILRNSYDAHRTRDWHQQIVHYNFCLPDDVLGGKLIPLPPTQAPLPLPGPLVDISHGWEEPYISSSPFVTPVATPSRRTAHEIVSPRTPGRTPAVSSQGLASRLFDASNPAQTAHRVSPQPSDSRSTSSTPTRTTSTFVGAAHRPSTPLARVSQAQTPSSSPSRSHVTQHPKLTSLPEPLRRLIVAFFPDDIRNATLIFAEAQSYENANSACSHVLTELPAWMSVKQFMFGLSYIFDSGNPIDEAQVHTAGNRSSQDESRDE